MRGMISDILNEMHTIKTMIQRPQVEIMSSNFFLKLGITFPTENDEDFEILGNALKTDKDFFNSGVSPDNFYSCRKYIFILFSPGTRISQTWWGNHI